MKVKDSILDPHYVFIAPPSLGALESRLRGRGTESQADIKKRLANAAGEMEYGHIEGNFDFVLVNNNLKTAFEKLVRQVQVWYPSIRSFVRPRPVVFCGPSGVGKGTIINLLLQRFPNEQFGFSVSHTTRNPRQGEVDGVHYHFTTVEAIKNEIGKGKFIEYAEVHGNYYGTSIASVESVQSKGKVCILDIDVQGVQNVKKSGLNPIYLFFAPPSMEALESRLRGRGTESEEDLQKRLANAQAELEYGSQAGHFDRVFINADLKLCFADVIEAFNEWYPQLDEVIPDDDVNAKTCTSCVIS